MTLSKSKLPTIACIFAVGLACVSLVAFGTGTHGIRHTLDLTARWSYLWFWLAYASGALRLFDERLRFVGKSRREFGLAFASAHSIHVLLIIWLYYISPKPPISIGGAVFFGIGIAFMYLMVVLSFKHIAAILPPWLWRWAMLVGLGYIEYAFLSDFWVNPFHANLKQLVGYLPFAVLGLFGTTLRAISAFGTSLLPRVAGTAGVNPGYWTSRPAGDRRRRA